MLSLSLRYSLVFFDYIEADDDNGNDEDDDDVDNNGSGNRKTKQKTITHSRGHSAGSEIFDWFVCRLECSILL